MGATLSRVFVGDGEFKFTPVSSIDRGYMKSLSGESTVTEQFDHALFCFSDDTGKEIRASARTPRPDPKLTDVLHDTASTCGCGWSRRAPCWSIC